MKLKGLLWTIAILAILFIICLVIYLVLKKDNDMNEIKGIKTLHYSYSVGYMMNANCVYDLTCEEDKCSIKIKPNGFPEEDARVYDVDKESLDKIIKILNTYKVSKWDGFRESDKNVLDGDSFAFSINMKDGKSISASGYMKWPTNYGNVKKELKEIFDSFIREGDFVRDNIG